MKKSVPLLLFLFSSVLFCGINNETVYANLNGVSPPLEEMYTQIGYKTVEEAVIEFENHFKKDVKLPFLVPSIPFTHYFGRFNDLETTMNDSLDIGVPPTKRGKHTLSKFRHKKSRLFLL